MASYQTFIESYLNEKQKNNRRLSYGEWLTANIDQSAQPSANLQSAQSAYGKASPFYGQAGESFGRVGLADSGFAHQRASQNYADFLDAGKETAALANKDFEGEYQKYLTQYEKKQEDTQKEVFSQLKAGKYTNVSKAYAHALSMGLSEDNAQKVAKQAVSYNEIASLEKRQTLRKTVFDAMIKQGMRSKSGYVYAIQCGLSEVEAKTLAEAAEAIYFGIQTGDRNLSIDDIYQQVENKVNNIFRSPLDLNYN